MLLDKPCLWSSNDRLLSLDAVVAAVEQHRIFPVFQPIFCLERGSLHGFEVLARWNDSESTSISPSEFIPAAAIAGVLDPLLAGLICQACQAAASCEGEFALNFNVSPLQLLHPTLPRMIRDAVIESAFPLERINIEITEAAVSDHRMTALQTAERIRALGVGLIMDDFGTGFSSLTRLNEFPFTGLKVDVIFVQSMEINPQSRKIVSAILGLGNSLGLSVVAEGAETPQQVSLLREMGICYGQGYFFHKGVSIQELKEFVRSAAGNHGTRNLVHTAATDAVVPNAQESRPPNQWNVPFV